MSEGCRHGHIANSCTACHEERRFRLRDARIEELTAERDAAFDRGLNAGNASRHEQQAALQAALTERDALKAELETQRSRTGMWKARCNHGTDASELQPGEEAYERLRTELERLRAEVQAHTDIGGDRDAWARTAKRLETENDRLRAEYGAACVENVALTRQLRELRKK